MVLASWCGVSIDDQTDVCCAANSGSVRRIGYLRMVSRSNSNVVGVRW